MKKFQNIDAVIILGGGVAKTLTPIFYTQERLIAFLKIAKYFSQKPIIVSGGWPHSMKKKPRYTEADVMRAFLLRYRVISPHHIYLEKKSRDTLHNALYSKIIIERLRSARCILLVTSTPHIHRARWIFKKVFGPQYRFIMYAVPTMLHITQTTIRAAYRHEHERFLYYRSLLKQCKAGDEKCITRVVSHV